MFGEKKRSVDLSGRAHFEVCLRPHWQSERFALHKPTIVSQMTHFFFPPCVFGLSRKASQMSPAHGNAAEIARLKRGKKLNGSGVEVIWT